MARNLNGTWRSYCLLAVRDRFEGTGHQEEWSDSGDRYTKASASSNVMDAMKLFPGAFWSNSKSIPRTRQFGSFAAIHQGATETRTFPEATGVKAFCPGKKEATDNLGKS